MVQISRNIILAFMIVLFHHFWKKNPALYFALSLLIGSGFAFTHSAILVIALSSFIFFRKEWILCLVISLFGYGYTSIYLPPLLPANVSLQGSGLFRISSISPCSSFQKRLLYQGEFLQFTLKDKNETFTHIPAFIFLINPAENIRPNAQYLYYLSGDLKPIRPSCFFFKPERKKSWEKKEKIFSLVELRYKVKEKISHFLEEKITHGPSYAFLNGLIVGTLDDRLLKFSFARLGLQHVMAISGSHFALLIFLLSFVLHRFFTKRKSLFILLFFVNLYFLFIGPAPSIQRAYLMVQVLICAQIFSKQSPSLNALGVALFLAILVNPMIVQDIGFQLSFLCTGALILATPLFSHFFSPIFKKRNEAPSLFHKVAYQTSTFIREAISLSCAINLWILPLLFYDFHKFPLLSLLYNLFFPILSFLPILLLLFSLFVHLLLPFAAPFCYSFTTFVTKAIIDIVLYPPTSLEMNLYCGSFPFAFLPIYWSLLLLAFIYWKETLKQKKEFLPLI